MMKLMRVPFVADLAVGRELRDKVEVPNYRSGFLCMPRPAYIFVQTMASLVGTWHSRATSQGAARSAAGFGWSGRHPLTYASGESAC
jgi:hypothetical protein